MLTLMAISVAAAQASPDIVSVRPQPGWLPTAPALAIMLGFLIALGALGALLLRRHGSAALAREGALRRDAEARLAALFGSLPDAVFVLRLSADGTLRVEAVNPGFERLFGVQAARVTEAPAEALLPAALAVPAVARWRQVARSAAAAEEEMAADLPAGPRRLRLALVPMRGPEGAVDRLLGSVRDVTATRSPRRGAAPSDRLATAGALWAGLAHEASQPLNAASLWLRRLRVAAEDVPEAARAPIARAAQLVEGQLRRAGELIARIRALAGEDARPAACFDAAGPVAAAVRRAAAHYAADGITLALRGAGAPLPVRGSAPRLEQAVEQLLSNARDAVMERRRTDRAAPARIDVVLRHEAGPPAPRVVIEVLDSGTGVAEAVAGAIFDPFFTTRDPGCGTGLGLPFAACVARGMGGGIETWNLPGGGACFRMELAAIPKAGGSAASRAA